MTKSPVLTFITIILGNLYMNHPSYLLPFHHLILLAPPFLYFMGSKQCADPSSPPPHSSPSRRWWTKETIAVVTGGNKGIGYAVVKRLAEGGLTVVLTSRDVSRGHKAVESLKMQGLEVEYFRLDVVDPTSVEAFVSWLKQAFGGLDVLVNNAGVSFNEVYQNSVEHAKTVIRTNYYGPKLLTQALLPLFRRSSQSISRILNISSRLGSFDKVSNPIVREILKDEEHLSEEHIDYIANQFLEDVKSGVWEKQGWPKVWTDYAVSKVALNAYTRLLAKRYKGDGLSVNCYCPGFTQTAMTGGQGKYSADSAAEVGVNIVLIPPQELPTGIFFIASNPFLYSKL